MAVKNVNVLKWCVEKGICEDPNDTRQAQNAIRWVKRNLSSCNIVCIKRGVYEAEESSLERAYSAHKNHCIKTSDERRVKMKKFNEQRKAAKADSEPHADAASPGEYEPPTSPPSRPSSPDGGLRSRRRSQRSGIGEGGDDT